MSRPKDGGPAFPVHVSDGGADLDGDLWFPGLSVRDYFAAKVIRETLHLTEHCGTYDYSSAAQCAYAVADAMLEARK